MRWNSFTRLANGLLLAIAGSPLFYTPAPSERVYPLKVIATNSVESYIAANLAAEGPRNLTLSEHVVSLLLTPAVIIRSRKSRIESYEQIFVDAIPLISCGQRADKCHQAQILWWEQMASKDVVLVSSWLILMNVTTYFLTTPHGSPPCSSLAASVVCFAGCRTCFRCNTKARFRNSLQHDASDCPLLVWRRVYFQRLCAYSAILCGIVTHGCGDKVCSAYSKEEDYVAQDS